MPLLPGTFVHGRILGAIQRDVIAVPRDAVINGTVFVAVPEASAESSVAEPQYIVAHAERRQVVVGRTLQSIVIIKSGIGPGDLVVMTNLDVIFEGARLRIDAAAGVRHLADELARLRTPQVRIVDEVAPLEPAGP